LRSYYHQYLIYTHISKEDFDPILSVISKGTVNHLKAILAAVDINNAGS
jgi:hypothetical protein